MSQHPAATARMSQRKQLSSSPRHVAISESTDSARPRRVSAARAGRPNLAGTRVGTPLLRPHFIEVAACSGSTRSQPAGSLARRRARAIDPRQRSIEMSSTQSATRRIDQSGITSGRVAEDCRREARQSMSGKYNMCCSRQRQIGRGRGRRRKVGVAEFFSRVCTVGTRRRHARRGM